MYRLDLQTGEPSIISFSFLNEIAPTIESYVRKHKQIPNNFLHINASGALALHVALAEMQEMSKLASFCTSLRRVARCKTAFYTYQSANFLGAAYAETPRVARARRTASRDRVVEKLCLCDTL